MHSAEWIRRLLQPVFARIRTLALRGEIALSNDTHKAQTLQIIVDAGPPLDSVERFGEFGFVSRPPKGAEVLVLCLGGDRSHPIAVATEYRNARPKNLAEGEAGLYSTSGGAVAARIMLRADGSVEITAGTVTISGDAVVSGDVSDAAGSMAEMRSLYNSHTHVENGGAGPTNPPLPLMT